MSGLLPNPKLEASVMAIRFVFMAGLSILTYIYWHNIFLPTNLALYVPISSQIQIQGPYILWLFFTYGCLVMHMSLSLWLFVPNSIIFYASLDTSTLVFRIPIGFGYAVRYARWKRNISSHEPSFSVICQHILTKFSLSLSRVQSTRVSNELGAGQPDAARLAAKVVIFLAVTEGILVSVIAIALRDVWGYFYADEEEVVKYMASIMPLLAVSNFMDGIQAVLSG